MRGIESDSEVGRGTESERVCVRVSKREGRREKERVRGEIE